MQEVDREPTLGLTAGFIFGGATLLVAGLATYLVFNKVSRAPTGKGMIEARLAGAVVDRTSTGPGRFTIPPPPKG